MDKIVKIPLILALLSAIITGFFCSINKYDTNQTCMRMIIAMLVFYILGIIIKSTITGIYEEVEKTRIENEKKEIEEKAKSVKQVNENVGTKLDLLAGDDDFQALELSKAIKTTLSE